LFSFCKIPSWHCLRRLCVTTATMAYSRLSVPLLAMHVVTGNCFSSEPQRAWAKCHEGAGREACVVRFNAHGGEEEQNSASVWATYMPYGKGGWPQLEITTRSATNPSQATASQLESEYFAAGVLEGALTCQDVANYWKNVREASHAMGQKGYEYLTEQDHWMREQARLLAYQDDYWFAVKMVIAQHDGLRQGQNMMCPEDMITAEELLILANDGDLYDLRVAWPASPEDPSYVLSLMARPWQRSLRGSHCSALFKLKLDHSDVYFAHDTWDTYATAWPRLFKTYTLPVLRGGKIHWHRDVFSSSPGYVSSMDDYYMIAGTAKLAVIETSLNIQDATLYRYLRPQSLPSWIRVMAANMLAHDAQEWTQVFSREQSGTYNCQWMVLDLEAFKRNGLVDNTFWVLEEMPGNIVKQDMSSFLREKSYWPSFNVAYFEETRRLINESSSWTDDVRAALFASFEASIDSIERMQWVMGWNDYLHNDISAGDPSKAIMARRDLLGDGSVVSGGMDNKVSSFRLYEEGMVTLGRVGPTHDEVPAFCWSTCRNQSVPHHGHPDCFQFEYERLWPGRSEPVRFV